MSINYYRTDFALAKDRETALNSFPAPRIATMRSRP
jgi:hypothetical protein